MGLREIRLGANITIRKARLSDLDALLALEYASFQTDRMNRRAMRRALLSDYQEIYIALSEGAAVGYCCLHFRKAAKAARLYSIAVLAAYRRQGIAAQLLDRCYRLSRKMGYERIRLEARAAANRLINFYTQQGFYPVGLAKNYYEDGADALRMERQLLKNKGKLVKRAPRTRLLIVVPRSQDRAAVAPLASSFHHAQIMTAREFLMVQDALGDLVRVINLCPADEYLASGYYVSLIAEARGNRTLAAIDSLSGLVSRKLYLNHLEELNRLLPKAALIEASLPEGAKKYSLEFYFGQTNHDWAKRLSKRCYALFAVPILEVQLIYKRRRWQVDYIWPLSISSVDDKDRPRFIEAAKFALAARLPHPVVSKSASFEMAILVDPNEQLPPSSPRALNLMLKAAATQNIHAELITKNDFGRLNNFDALFIRTTTQIDHYTYRFATAAEKLGLVVIDDPQSILRCSNKVYLTEALGRAAIDMPKSWLITRSNLAHMADELSYPVVLKIPDGSFSRGMHKVKGREDFVAHATSMLGHSFVVLAQEFMPTDFDWRIGVLNGRPIFACQYFMSRGHWQIYHHKAGNKIDSGGFACLPLEDVPEIVLQTAIKASLVIGQGLYGVDIKLIDGRALVIEVNDNPNIDAGVEDKIAGGALYTDIMALFRARILARKGVMDTPLFDKGSRL